MVLVVSFVALAVLWPEPKLQRDAGGRCPGASGACSRAVRSRSSAARSACCCSGSRSTPACAAPRARRRTSPRSFVYVIFWLGLVVGERAARRRLQGVQPLARDRALGGRGSPGCSRAASCPRRCPIRSGSAAGRPPPGSSASRRSSSWPRTATGPRTSRSPRSSTRRSRSSRWRSTASSRWIERGEAFSVYFNLFSRTRGVRDARRARSGCARRSRGSRRFRAAPARCRCWR